MLKNIIDPFQSHVLHATLLILGCNKAEMYQLSQFLKLPYGNGGKRLDNQYISVLLHPKMGKAAYET